jgi:hypothetical protein
MSDRAPLLEILRLLASAGCIDGKVFLRDEGAGAEVQAVWRRSTRTNRTVAGMW